MAENTIEKIELTQEEAICLAEQEVWKGWSARERALFQIRCGRLCMPFDVFHKAVEETLGRPVWTHEFGLNMKGLYLEMLGDQPAPTMQEIIGLIPKDKLVVIAGAAKEGNP